MIAGLQKLTLLDYPGRTACTVFLQGCDFRCPFCHNYGLIPDDPGEAGISEDELLGFLSKRKNMLDGVCISGGEPLMHGSVIALMRDIKALGYDIKVDTNGSFPDRLREAAESGLCDYIAMDIKNSPEKYAVTAGAGCAAERIEESITYIMHCGLPYEFRTTAVREFHEPEDFEKIGRRIEGADRYFIQNFRDPGNEQAGMLHACGQDELERFLEAARRYVPAAELRG